MFDAGSHPFTIIKLKYLRCRAQRCAVFMLIMFYEFNIHKTSIFVIPDFWSKLQRGLPWYLNKTIKCNLMHYNALCCRYLHFLQDVL